MTAMAVNHEKLILFHVYLAIGLLPYVQIILSSNYKAFFV